MVYQIASIYPARLGLIYLFLLFYIFYFQFNETAILTPASINGENVSGVYYDVNQVVVSRPNQIRVGVA